LYNQLPNLESLRCFVAAAQTLNFRKAAKQVFLSPGAFSERIQRLEEQLGVSLFIRSTRHIALSTEGMRLLSRATSLLEEAQRFHSFATCTDLKIELTIGTRYELGTSFLLPLLEDFQQSHPQWHFHLFFGDAPSLRSALLSSEIDVALSSMRIDHPRIQIQTTHKEEYVLVASSKIAQGIHSLDDLHPHVLVDISSAYPLFRYFGESNQLRPHELFSQHRYLGTISALLHWVEYQDAIAVLPLYFVQPALKEGRVKRLFPEKEVQHDYFRFFWLQGHWAEQSITELALLLSQHPLQ